MENTKTTASCSIKLICVDVDGTLVDDNKNIPPDNLKEIERANRLGIKIAITSGRISPSTQIYMEKIGVSGAVSSLGGCMLEDEERRIIAEYTLDSRTSALVNELANRNSFTIFAYCHYHWYSDSTLADPFWLEEEERITSIKGVFVSNLQKEVLDRFNPNKFLIMHRNPQKIAAFRQYLVSVLDPEKANTFFSGPNYIEVVPAPANKGTAVRDLQKYYGIAKENTMAIGDYYNDLFMFKEAGVSVAAANAPEDLKTQVTYVTQADCNRGVVAEAIRKFI